MAVDRTAGSGRRDGVRSRRRSGDRGQASEKRRRNGQSVDDIRVRIPRWGDKKSFVGGKRRERALHVLESVKGVRRVLKALEDAGRCGVRWRCLTLWNTL